MSEQTHRNVYVGTPSSSASLLHPTRRNREVAKALKTDTSQWSMQRNNPERGTYRPEERNPDEISLPTHTTDEVLPDIPGPGPLRRKETEMSKPVLFYGKPSQIQDLQTHCTVKFAADGITDETQKAGVFASAFRGPALTWLTQHLATEPNALHDYEELVAQTSKAFGLTPEAEQGRDARKLASLRQRKSVQDYGLEFKQLADKVRLPDDIAKATFIKGLKPHIARALITVDEQKSLEDAIEEATRIDSQLYNINATYGRRGNQRNKTGKPGRDNKGRFKSESQY